MCTEARTSKWSHSLPCVGVSDRQLCWFSYRSRGYWPLCNNLIHQGSDWNEAVLCPVLGHRTDNYVGFRIFHSDIGISITTLYTRDHIEMKPFFALFWVLDRQLCWFSYLSRRYWPLCNKHIVYHDISFFITRYTRLQTIMLVFVSFTRILASL